MNIAIDLGGTSIRAAKVSDDGIIEVQCSEPCHATGSEQDVLDQIFRLTESLGTEGVDGIGIGVPSVVDTERGIVYNVTGIPSWKEVHLKEKLSQRFGLPVAVDNDSNCFALGVARFDVGRGRKDLVCITLGTGVGSCLVIDGRLYHGRNCGAGEIGSIRYLDRDYEYYCSSRYFKGLGTTGKDAATAARAQDPAALKLWADFGIHIGHLVETVQYAYDPSMIVLGGSIAKAFELFRPSMEETIRNFPYPESIRNLTVTCARLDNPALLGASVLFREQQ